ncbi:MAG: hypothetical protein WCG42_01105 [Parachlamydiaceae bacterium]
MLETAMEEVQDRLSDDKILILLSYYTTHSELAKDVNMNLLHMLARNCHGSDRFASLLLKMSDVYPKMLTERMTLPGNLELTPTEMTIYTSYNEELMIAMVNKYYENCGGLNMENRQKLLFSAQWLSGSGACWTALKGRNLVAYIERLPEVREQRDEPLPKRVVASASNIFLNTAVSRDENGLRLPTTTEFQSDGTVVQRSGGATHISKGMDSGVFASRFGGFMQLDPLQIAPSARPGRFEPSETTHSASKASGSYTINQFGVHKTGTPSGIVSSVTYQQPHRQEQARPYPVNIIESFLSTPIDSSDCMASNAGSIPSTDEYVNLLMQIFGKRLQQRSQIIYYRTEKHCRLLVTNSSEPGRIGIVDSQEYISDGKATIIAYPLRGISEELALQMQVSLTQACKALDIKLHYIPHYCETILDNYRVMFSYGGRVI